jgi:parallel beta-helix repeat protein
VDFCYRRTVESRGGPSEVPTRSRQQEEESNDPPYLRALTASSFFYGPPDRRRRRTGRRQSQHPSPQSERRPQPPHAWKPSAVRGTSYAGSVEVGIPSREPPSYRGHVRRKPILLALIVSVFFALNLPGASSAPPKLVAPVLSAAVTGTEVPLTWTDAGGETSYHVMRLPPDGVTWIEVATPRANTLQYKDSGLSPSTTYHYVVVATRGWKQVNSNAIQVTTGVTPSLPPSPSPSPTPSLSPNSSPSPSPLPSPSPNYSPSPSFSPSPSPSPTTPSSSGDSIGPQPTITCPSGVVNISPGTQIQPIVNAHPSGTAFCLKAGVHSVTSTIYPKTGQSFIGEYGAILDGGRSTNIAFKDGGTGVTIRNLEIRNFGPEGAPNQAGTSRGAIYSSNASSWVVEHNNVHDNAGIGIRYFTGFRIRYNRINRNAQYGLSSYMTSNVIVEYNEVSYNNLGHFNNADEGGTKFAASDGLVIRGNDFHDNYGTAVWLDTRNRNVTIENNVITDNEKHGIFYEISYNGVIRNNLIARNGRVGIYVKSSTDVEIYSNVVEGSGLRDIMLFMSKSDFDRGFDLRNVVVQENVVRVQGTGGWAGVYSGLSVQDMDPTPYYASKGNHFEGNVWYVSSLSGKYWYWNNGYKTWSEWQNSQQDTIGSCQLT